MACSQAGEHNKDGEIIPQQPSPAGAGYNSAVAFVSRAKRFLGLLSNPPTEVNAKAPIYRPHHYMLYELAPNYVSADGLTHHNSYGFRGAEFQIEKPASVCRIVCMGESTTYSTGIKDDAQTYPARLAAHLSRDQSEREIEVLNAGVGGYTSAENLLQFIFRVQPLQPDIVVFYYTHNDVHPRRLPTLSRDYREYSKAWHQSPFEKFGLGRFALRVADMARRQSPSLSRKVRRLDEYKGRIRAAHVEDNPPTSFHANMGSLALLARGWGIRMLFVNPSYRFLEQENPELTWDLVSKGVSEHRLSLSESPRNSVFLYLTFSNAWLRAGRQRECGY